MDYEAYIRSEEWFERRRRFFERDSRRKRCYVCRRPKSADEMHVHHLSYERLGDEPDDHLAAVCPPCHRAIHQMARMHPELTLLGATAVLRRMGLGDTYAQACARWLLTREGKAWRRGSSQMVGVVAADGAIVDG